LTPKGVNGGKSDLWVYPQTHRKLLRTITQQQGKRKELSTNTSDNKIAARESLLLPLQATPTAASSRSQQPAASSRGQNRTLLPGSSNSNRSGTAW